MESLLIAVPVDHDVGQRVPPLPPAAERLAVVLELTVPHFRLFAVLALENRTDRLGTRARAYFGGL